MKKRYLSLLLALAILCTLLPQFALLSDAQSADEAELTVEEDEIADRGTPSDPVAVEVPGYEYFLTMKTPFVDVKSGAWYYAPVAWAYYWKITGGIDKTHFGPDKTCTRAQVVQFLYAATHPFKTRGGGVASDPVEVEGGTAFSFPKTPFVDVKKDAWYYDAVTWAYYWGVTGGIDKTHFGPNQTCTRAQVIQFIWCAKGQPEAAGLTNRFADVPRNAWYYDAVLWAYYSGVAGGVDATHFGPDQDCTRAQVVTFLSKAWAQ